MESRATALERDLCNLKDIVIEEKRRLNGNLERINKRLEAMDDKLQSVTVQSLQKPSWGTTFAITTLVGAVCTLATWIITR